MRNGLSVYTGAAVVFCGVVATIGIASCASSSVEPGSTVDNEKTPTAVTIISDQDGDSIHRFCDGPNMVYIDNAKNDVGIAANDPRCPGAVVSSPVSSP